MTVQPSPQNSRMLAIVCIPSNVQEDDRACSRRAVGEGTFPIRQVWFSDEEQVSGNDYDAFIDAVASMNVPITRPTETVHTFPGFANFELRVFNNGRESAGSAAAAGN